MRQRDALQGRAYEKVAGRIRKHFDGFVACAQTSQTNGFVEAKARGYGRPQAAPSVPESSYLLHLSFFDLLGWYTRVDAPWFKVRRGGAS